MLQQNSSKRRKVIKSLKKVLRFRKRRGDGTFVENLHPYRRLMFFMMPTRNESAVYYDEYYPADRLEAYLLKAKKKFDTNMTHAVVASVASALHHHPELNRFVVGRRLYQRDGVYVTFSVKRKKKNARAKLSVIKMKVNETDTFRELCERINKKIDSERSEKKTMVDWELHFLNLLPRMVLNAASRAVRWMDYNNIVPSPIVASDGMYTSIFIANLGSIEMTPGYHHLYEWGNCPLFMMVGQAKDMVFAEDGKPVVRKMIPIRYTYDERINDGLSARYGIDAIGKVISDPERYLGCLEEDESDAHLLAFTLQNNASAE